MQLNTTVCAVLSVFALTTSAFAYPSLLGPTGSASLPTAAVVEQGGNALAIDAQFYDANTTGLDNAYLLRVERGIAKNMELGFTTTLQQIDGAPSDVNEDSFGINAKYLLVNTDGVSLGVGGMYQNFANADNDVDYLSYGATATNVQSFTQWYGVLTAQFAGAGNGSPSIHGSIGVNSTHVIYDNEDTDGNTWTYSQSATRPFVSLDLGFPEANGDIHLTGEYQAKDDTLPGDLEPITSFVLRIPISRGGALEVGTSNVTYGVFGSGDQHMFAGLELFR
jgi:hypothetical protein